jgi:cytochrome bd-type quinol oxidase subunit 2
MTSPDGLTWSTTRWKIWPNGWDEQLIGIAWGRGTYLAVSRSVVCLASSERTERKERVAESVMGAFSLGVITFTMSGVGLLCYIVLQVRAIRRMTGYWRLFAWLPVPAMLAVLAATGVAARKESNLWPLLLIFFVPVALIYLLLLLALRWVVAKPGRQDQR